MWCDKIFFPDLHRNTIFFSFNVFVYFLIKIKVKVDRVNVKATHLYDSHDILSSKVIPMIY